MGWWVGRVGYTVVLHMEYDRAGQARLMGVGPVPGS